MLMGKHSPTPGRLLAPVVWAFAVAPLVMHAPADVTERPCQRHYLTPPYTRTSLLLFFSPLSSCRWRNRPQLRGFRKYTSKAHAAYRRDDFPRSKMAEAGGIVCPKKDTKATAADTFTLLGSHRRSSLVPSMCGVYCRGLLSVSRSVLTGCSVKDPIGL